MSWQESMKALFRPGAKVHRGLAAEWVSFWLPARQDPSVSDIAIIRLFRLYFLP